VTYRSSRRRRLQTLGISALALSFGLTACGRSGSPASTGKSASAAPSAAASSAVSKAGSFGSLSNICGPGDAKGATARGVTDSTIDIATLADPGNSILPGLTQEFFDTGDAFVKWCNAAGGINGRKIVLHKRDAKLVPQVFQSFTADNQPVNPVADISLRVALDDLKWWSEILEKARANGQLPPAAFRIQAAAAALNEVEDEAV
jgi:hypothetical protein